MKLLFLFFLTGFFFTSPVHSESAAEPDEHSTSLTDEAHSGTEASVQPDEIRRPQVRRVNIRGNDTFADVVLKNNIATEAPGFFRRIQFWRRGGFDFSETEVRRDVIRIERFYLRRGFYEVDITYEIEVGDEEYQRNVIFLVDEGEPTLVQTLDLVFVNTDPKEEEEIRGLRAFQRAEARNPLQEGRRYERVRHPDMGAAFHNALRNSGYAFSDTRIEAVVDTVNRQADLSVIMEPRQQATFRDIQVEGVQTVPEDLVLYQSAIREGDLYSQDRMRDAQQLLFRHPLIRFATITIPDQEMDEFVDLRIRIREQPLRSVQVLAGVGDEELLRGRVTWIHRNPLGNGHRFSISTRASFIEQRGNIEYLIPGFLNPRSNLSISPFALRRDEESYRINRLGVNNNLTYYHSQQLIGSMSYEFSLNDEAIVDGTGVRSDSTRVYNISALKLSALYNESTPEEGQGWGIRPYAEFSGLLGTGTLSYQKFTLDIRRFIDITPTSKLALRTDSGLLLSDDPFDTPANIRLYAGGSNSVRGFARRQLGPKRPVFDMDGNFQQYLPLGGQSLLMFNTELRQDIPFLLDGLQLAGFLDGGQVWLNYDEINLQEFQYGAGGGVRYMSPIGPIRVDIGWKLNPRDEDLNRYEGERFNGVNRWAIHFSIGQAF